MVVRPIYTPKLVLAAAAASLIALAGCGTMPAPGSSSPAKTPATARVALTFTVTNGPGKSPSHWTLTCDPAGGTRKDPASACSRLLGLKRPFAAPPKHRMCPMIMVSDRQVKVTGTWFGAKVNRVLIDGGCDLAIFGKITKIIN